MALENCTECGNQVSSKAKTCPSCGHAVKGGSKILRVGGIGCGLFILLIVLGGIFGGNDEVQITQPSPSLAQASDTSVNPGEPSEEALIGSQSSSEDVDDTRSEVVGSNLNNDTPTEQIYNMGEQVDIGYMSYLVNEAAWIDSLTANQFIDDTPDGRYLVISVTARNQDSKARQIPPFYLIDSSGAEYQESSNRFYLDGHFEMMKALNPSLSRDGVLVFDVPPKSDYKLKLSGGYWSADSAFVNVEADPLQN